MQKRAAGACCTVDDLFRQDLKVLAIVGVFITKDADRAQPAMADTNHLIAFAQGANGDRADCGIEPRHIPAAGENTDHAFVGAHATALLFSSSMQKKNPRNRFDVQEASLRARYRFPLRTASTTSRIASITSCGCSLCISWPLFVLVICFSLGTSLASRSCAFFCAASVT